MEGSKVTAIVSGSVLLVAIIVGFVLYFLFCYKKWQISTENQRKQYKLNKLFSSFEGCCSGSTREETSPSLNVPHTRVDIHTEHRANTDGLVATGVAYDNKKLTEHRANTDGLVSTGVAYDNKKMCVSIIDVNTSDVDLQVPQSPIRKSAETYSYVDLHDET